MSKALDLQSVTVQYGDFVAAREVSLHLDAGSIGCLLGPSGCGKTSLLRAIAGFEPIASGEIHLGNEVIASTTVEQAPEARRVGMLFQDFALFPHLTVLRNVAFGLRSLGRQQRRQRAMDLLQLVGLEHRAGAMPHELSGGQQQRVALARALAPEPDIVLLDEPFSSLDTELRTQLASEVRQLLKNAGSTAVLVTHDQQEAFAMADSISLMHHGEIVQTGSAAELYREPANHFVAGFIGRGSLLRVSVDADGRLGAGLGELPALAGRGEVELLVRPEHVFHSPGATLQGQVVECQFSGAHWRCRLQLTDGQHLHCLVSSATPVEAGQQLPVAIAVQDVYVLPPRHTPP